MSIYIYKYTEYMNRDSTFLPHVICQILALQKTNIADDSVTSNTLAASKLHLHCVHTGQIVEVSMVYAMAH